MAKQDEGIRIQPDRSGNDDIILDGDEDVRGIATDEDDDDEFDDDEDDEEGDETEADEEGGR